MTEPAYPRPYGTYTLLERLGVGGMSEVDLARRTAGEGTFVRFIVIKRIRAGNQIDEQYVRMFQDEARINAELSHENIAQVYDFGREGDEFYMAMEYVPGLDLRAVQLALAKRGKLLPVRLALSILCGVLRALQYAHTRVDQLGRPMNIVHRDVNPRNVMLSVNGEVKLIDFGVAKAADRLEKTEGNAVKGKFAYMAPEQIDGNAAVDGRADLFAVALVFHELLTGKSPFAGLTEVQILHRILAGKIPPLPDGIDHPDLPRLRRIHARGLATRPQDRFPTADAFRVEIEAALAPIGGIAPPLWIGELLREAAGEGVTDITRRLRSYREGLGSTGPRIVVAPPPAESSGTLNVASIEAPPDVRPVGVAWAAVALAFVAVILGGMGMAGGGAAWLMWARDADVVAPTPIPVDAVQTAPAPPTPADVSSAPPTPPKVVPTPTAADAVQTAPARRPAATGSPAVAVPGQLPDSPVSDTPAPAPVVVTPVATVATVTPPAAASAPQVAAAEEVAYGFLNLTSRPQKLEVYVDGKKVGLTPLRLHRLPTGSHAVAVRDPVTGRSETRTVDIAADVPTTPAAVILE